MDTQDPVIQKTELVMDALTYSLEHKLSIDSLEDVKKILEGVDAQNENPEEFMKLLQKANAFMEMKATERKTKLN